MENATKALIIAAAILIAIVLISIGVYVLRQGQEAMNSANLTEAQILEFNGKFTSYAGTQRGSAVNALKDRLEIVNRELKNSGGTEITLTAPATISTSKYYKVDVSTKDKAGLIKEIKVEEVNN